MRDLRERFADLDLLETPEMRNAVDARIADPQFPVGQSRTKPPRTQQWRGPLVAVGTAVLVVIAVAGAVLLTRGFGITEGPVATTTIPSPTTTVPSPTTTVSSPTTTALGEEAPTVSVESLTWTRVPLGGADSEAEAIASFDGGLVVVGQTPDGAAVWTSPDGTTWMQAPHDETFGPALNEGTVGMATGMVDVAVDGSNLVAVGGHPSLGPAAWTSTDGLEWSSASISGGADHSLEAVTAGGPGFVAVGGWQVLTSVEGRAWTVATCPECRGDDAFGGWQMDVAAGGPKLVMVGFATSTPDGGAAVWTSADGLAWERVPHDGMVFGGPWVNMHAVTEGGPGFVAVGGGPLAQSDVEGEEPPWVAWVWTSADGTTWQRVPHDGVAFSADTSMNDVISVGDTLVAVGGEHDGSFDDEHAAIWTSADGVVWNRAPHDDAVFGYTAMNSVAVFGDGLVAVGDGSAWIATPEP